MGADSVTFTEYANASGGYNGYVWLEGQSKQQLQVIRK